MKLFSQLPTDPAPPEEPKGPQLDPKEFASIVSPETVEQYRRLNCKHYERCLDIAIDQVWFGFHCNDCTAFVPLSKEKMMKAARGLFAIFDSGKILQDR